MCVFTKGYFINHANLNLISHSELWYSLHEKMSISFIYDHLQHIIFLMISFKFTFLIVYVEPRIFI